MPQSKQHFLLRYQISVSGTGPTDCVLEGGTEIMTTAKKKRDKGEREKERERDRQREMVRERERETHTQLEER